MSLQLLVLRPTPSMSAGGAGPAREVETPAGQRAAGRPPEGQADGSQQHGQQLQPEGKGHMRGTTAAPSSRQQQKH